MTATPTWVTGSKRLQKTRGADTPVAQQTDKVESAPGWDVEDWLGFFDERAGFAELDGKLSRADAEARAYECCVAQWMNIHTPEPTEPEHGCASCGGSLPGNDALPFLTRGGHCWLHSRCHRPWMQQQRDAAVVALVGLGVTPPRSPTTDQF